MNAARLYELSTTCSPGAVADYLRCTLPQAQEIIAFARLADAVLYTARLVTEGDFQTARYSTEEALQLLHFLATGRWP